MEENKSEVLDFKESRSVTFATVAATEFYTTLVGDITSSADLFAIDWMTVSIGSIPEPLSRMRHSVMEDLSLAATQTGQPTNYSYFNEQIRLWPVPTDAWTVRIGGLIKKAAPATDSVASNDWMTVAEVLIRSRAKYELAIHVLRDEGLAVAMSPFTPPPGIPGGYAAWRAEQVLKGRVARQVGTGRIRPMVF